MASHAPAVPHKRRGHLHTSSPDSTNAVPTMRAFLAILLPPGRSYVPRIRSPSPTFRRCQIIPLLSTPPLRRPSRLTPQPLCLPG